MQPGTVVVVRDESWTVASTEAFERCTLVTLDGSGPGNMGLRFQVVTPFDTVRPIEAGPPRLRKRQAVLRTALTAIAHDRPALGLWTTADANLDLLPYQLEPALAVLRGATRVLLADAVGLGKTIQAALILSELRARGLVDRALILCPAGLRASWQAELRDRFGLSAAVLDHSALDSGLVDQPAGVNPWTSQPVVIASIDFVKRPEVLAAVEAAAVDLVIADEAHHLTPGSDRGRAVERLAARAPWLLLLSATPHSGDRAAFEYLTGIGSLGDPLAVFRRGRRDAGLPANRHDHLLGVAPTADEDHLLRAVTAYARAIWQARGRSDRAVQLVAITLARRAASSAAALGRTLVRRLDLLSGAAPSQPIQASFEWEDDDQGDGDEFDQTLACPGLDDGQDERGRIKDLIGLAARAGLRSSKLRRLQRLLTRSGEPAVVFTEYRDTLSAAVDALTGHFRIGAIHGGLPAAVRQEVIQQFQRGGLDVLVATDTAGEGLNLHQRCRLVVDLELPWNPLRLEQRVGRVDRLGQERRVHAVHLLHRQSIEDTVWRHLERRRRLAGLALEDLTPPSEEDVARAVFDDGSLPLPEGRPLALTSIDEAPAEAARAGSQRRLRRRAGAQRRLRRQAGATSERGVYAWPRRRRYRDDRGIALVESTWLGSTGGMIERRVCAFQVDAIPSGNGSGPRSWRQAAERIVTLVDSPLPPRLQSTREQVLARIAGARARLASAPALHQASLFDRRAALAAGARREVANFIGGQLSRRAASLMLTTSLQSHRRLIAYWPVRRKP
jgi:superfamily II DNA or RNA helicase